MLSRRKAGEPSGAKGQFGGFLSRRTEMDLVAWDAPVGGSARESKTAPTKRNGIATGNADAMWAGTHPGEGWARVGNGHA